ncbi:hypothetical protein [Bradyrhizobium sp. AZCC 2230]|uniref:hypothetical protein n=1 Tax=Bradyrhizobium sp. AZCC 2230 TaxID=3117021 RepID=UPI002FF3594A
MDARETAAMTEASGLTNFQDGIENPSRATLGARKQADLRLSEKDWAERLRKVTVEAPLRSLMAAFALGVWFARRR